MTLPRTPEPGGCDEYRTCTDSILIALLVTAGPYQREGIYAELELRAIHREARAKEKAAA